MRSERDRNPRRNTGLTANRRRRSTFFSSNRLKVSSSVRTVDSRWLVLRCSSDRLISCVTAYSANELRFGGGQVIHLRARDLLKYRFLNRRLYARSAATEVQINFTRLKDNRFTMMKSGNCLHFSPHVNSTLPHPLDVPAGGRQAHSLPFLATIQGTILMLSSTGAVGRKWAVCGSVSGPTCGGFSGWWVAWSGPSWEPRRVLPGAREGAHDGPDE